MKKIGLITIHDTLNYGSLLQTYALYKAIESLGVEIELIDSINNDQHFKSLTIFLQVFRMILPSFTIRR